MKKLLIALFTLSLLAMPSAQAETPVIRIVDKAHTNFDGTFRNNELAASLLPNGKLGKLIFGLTSSKRTFLIDAALISEVENMADGYTFGGKEDAAGSQTARNWLFRLRNVVAYNDVVALPFGNPDEKLVKSLAPSELKFYSLYAQAKLQASLKRSVSAQNGWRIHQHEIALTKYLLEGLSAISDLRTIGPKTTELRGGVVSFTLGDIHPHDLGQYLDSQGIAVRTGHHCAWPLTRKLGVPATTRASIYLYNTTDDLDALIAGVQGAQKYFGR